MIIDVYADIACPWCYIGKRRLEQALALRPDIVVERHWRPFQLQPDLPATGIPWQEFVPRKFGGTQRAQSMFAHVAQAGAPDGIDFRFDNVATAANTRDAHRLILYASEQNQEWPAAEALFKAYFTDGRNLNDLDDLAAVGASVGLDEAALRDYLTGSANSDIVDESQDLAAQLGIQGVPFYVINQRYGISGAQPVEVFLQMLDKIHAEE
jgi:predicted DsbA family dithiol-disulfide isomerase